MILGPITTQIALKDINEGKGLNKDQYDGVFNTSETDVSKFWDGLNTGKSWLTCGKRSYATKVSVGSLALDQGFMKASYHFDCTATKFADLKPKQQRIIKAAAAFKCKDEMYSILPIRGLCRDLFHIR